MKLKLKEQEDNETPTTPDSEETSSPGSGGFREKINYDLRLTSLGEPISKVVAAFEEPKNYGIYLSNLRNYDTRLRDAMEKYFGPSIPAKKRAAEKLRGKPFPPKSKPAIDHFIKKYNERYGSNMNLLNFEILSGDALTFPFDKNPQKELTRKIIKTVMDNAGIKYELDSIERVEESVKNKLNKIVKEILKNPIKENISLSPDLAFKIYDILKSQFPEIGKEYTKSAFYYFLNDNIK